MSILKKSRIPAFAAALASALPMAAMADYSQPHGPGQGSTQAPGYSSSGSNNGGGRGGDNRGGGSDNRGGGDSRGGGDNRGGDNRGGNDNRGGSNNGGSRNSRSSVIGSVENVDTKSGSVYGWACDTKSRNAIEVLVKIDGRVYENSRVVAEEDMSRDQKMGLPSRECGKYAGFKLAIPSEALTGRKQYLQVYARADRNSDLVELDGSGIQNVLGGAKKLREGQYMIGNKIYYSNGLDAYCQITPDLVPFLAPNFRQTPDNTYDVLPTEMRNDGKCQGGSLPVGFFSASGSVFYSFGNGHFCGLSSPDALNHMAASVGVNLKKTSVPAQPSVPPFMANDGLCHTPPGLIQVRGQATIYYSNGRDAYCGVPNPDFLIRHWPNQPVFQYNVLPGDLGRRDAVCAE